jgi:hypothetical protein
MIRYPRNDAEQGVHMRRVQSGLDGNVSKLQVGLSLEGLPRLLVWLYSGCGRTAEVIGGLK